jgi:mitochondrial ornithine carrier protein
MGICPTSIPTALYSPARVSWCWRRCNHEFSPVRLLSFLLFSRYIIIIRTPIELVKCKMQVQMLAIPITISASSAKAMRANLPGPIAILSSIIRSTGVRGLWLGHTGTLIREAGGTAAWFATKEFVASLLVARRLRDSQSSLQSQSHSYSHPSLPHPPHSHTQSDLHAHPNPRTDLLLWESAFSGACAGAAFNIALFPADTVKSAIQTEDELRPQSSTTKTTKTTRTTKTFLGTFMAMYKAHGIRGLYAGCGITVARSIPSSAMIFFIYDGLCRRFG